MADCDCIRCTAGPEFEVSGRPVCWECVADELREQLSPTEDGRPGSVMVPVGLARPEPDAAA